MCWRWKFDDIAQPASDVIPLPFSVCLSTLRRIRSDYNRHMPEYEEQEYKQTWNQSMGYKFMRFNFTDGGMHIANWLAATCTRQASLRYPNLISNFHPSLFQFFFYPNNVYLLLSSSARYPKASLTGHIHRHLSYLPYLFAYLHR